VISISENESAACPMRTQKPKALIYLRFLPDRFIRAFIKASGKRFSKFIAAMSGIRSHMNTKPPPNMIM
jgi:hypothetical protein